MSPPRGHKKRSPLGYLALGCVVGGLGFVTESRLVERDLRARFGEAGIRIGRHEEEGMAAQAPGAYVPSYLPGRGRV